MTDDADLAELVRLQKLRDAASPGPWAAREAGNGRHYSVSNEVGMWMSVPAGPHTAAFIASAHDAVALAERLAQRLREARAEVIEQCALAVDQMKNGLTASVGEAGGLVPDQDGPWFLKSECAAAIRALKPTEGKP